MHRICCTLLLVFGLLMLVTPTLPAHAATETLWPVSAGPSGNPGSDSASIEIGTRFQTSTAGSILGVRFYKSSLSTTAHTGNVWTSSGALLGSVTFSGETASGWQEADFQAPIAIAANTLYVVSYHTAYYRATLNYFGSPLDSGSLQAPVSAGVYAYGNGPSLFPASSYSNANYWVDVAFSAGTVPTVTPSPTPSATPTPSPTTTPAVPSPTPTATPTPVPDGEYTCTEVIGFSVTESWYSDGFIQAVPGPGNWQLRWFSGGSIDQWAAGASFVGWQPQNLVTHCATGSSAPDRIILNVSGQYSTDSAWWASQTQQTLAYIKGTYAPTVRVIVLQAPLGGPQGSMCPTSDSLAAFPWVRATYNWPFIEAGLDSLLGPGVEHGAWTQVRDCSDYSDWAGHLTVSARQPIGATIAAFYSQR